MYQKLNILDNQSTQNNIKIFLLAIIYFYLIKYLNINNFYQIIFLDLFIVAVIALNKLQKASNITVGIIMSLLLLNNIFNLLLALKFILIKTCSIILTIKIFINNKTLNLYLINIAILIILLKYYLASFKEILDKNSLPKTIFR